MSIIDNFRVSHTRDALKGLVVAVAYADLQWLRHTDAFGIAVEELGYKMDWRENRLFDENGYAIPNPYERTYG